LHISFPILRKTFIAAPKRYQDRIDVGHFACWIAIGYGHGTVMMSVKSGDRPIQIGLAWQIRRMLVVLTSMYARAICQENERRTSAEPHGRCSAATADDRIKIETRTGIRSSVQRARLRVQGLTALRVAERTSLSAYAPRLAQRRRTVLATAVDGSASQ
jgi:hypothetical protein